MDRFGIGCGYFIMEVDIGRIHLLTKALEQRAGSSAVAEQVLKNSNLSKSAIAPPATTYSAHSEALFVRHACDALDDITFGAQAGLQFVSASSLTAYISKYSRDLKQVMENTARFHRFIDPALAFSLRVSGNHAALEAEWKDPRFSRYHRRTEFLLFAAIARMRALTQVKITPIQMRFPHTVGRHEAAFSKLGGFPVIFGAEKPEIILTLSALEQSVPTYDPALRQHLLEHGEHLLAQTPSNQQKLRAKVEGLITQSLPGTIIPADKAAEHLGLSARTFARRLREEGTSYREIVEDLRCDLAQTFIKNGLVLTEISYALGYADQAAFSTAFKRWTGQAPSAFRKRVEHPISH